MRCSRIVDVARCASAHFHIHRENRIGGISVFLEFETFSTNRNHNSSVSSVDLRNRKHRPSEFNWEISLFFFSLQLSAVDTLQRRSEFPNVQLCECTCTCQWIHLKAIQAIANRCCANKSLCTARERRNDFGRLQPLQTINQTASECVLLCPACTLFYFLSIFE